MFLWLQIPQSVHRIKADHQGFWATFPSVVQEDEALVSWLQNCSTISTPRDYKLIMKPQGCNLVKMRLAYHRFIDDNYRSLYQVSTTGCLHSAEIMSSGWEEQHIFSTGTVRGTELMAQNNASEHRAWGTQQRGGCICCLSNKCALLTSCSVFLSLSFPKLWWTALCISTEGKGWLVWGEEKLSMPETNGGEFCQYQFLLVCTKEEMLYREKHTEKGRKKTVS